MRPARHQSRSRWTRRRAWLPHPQTIRQGSGGGSLPRQYVGPRGPRLVFQPEDVEHWLQDRPQRPQGRPGRPQRPGSPSSASAPLANVEGLPHDRREPAQDRSAAERGDPAARRPVGAASLHCCRDAAAHGLAGWPGCALRGVGGRQGAARSFLSVHLLARHLCVSAGARQHDRAERGCARAVPSVLILPTAHPSAPWRQQRAPARPRERRPSSDRPACGRHPAASRATASDLEVAEDNSGGLCGPDAPSLRAGGREAACPRGAAPRPAGACLGLSHLSLAVPSLAGIWESAAGPVRRAPFPHFFVPNEDHADAWREAGRAVLLSHETLSLSPSPLSFLTRLSWCAGLLDAQRCSRAHGPQTPQG